MVSFGESGFDAEAPENQRASSVLPAGEYPAIMTESERVSTKAGDGAYLKTKWQIVAGEFQNRVIFANFNLWLPPVKAVALNIARGQFSEFCKAVSTPNPKDSSELHNKVCMVKLKVKVDDQYGDKNEIAGFKAAGSVPAKAAPATATANPWA